MGVRRAWYSKHAGYTFSLAAWVVGRPALASDTADQENTADVTAGLLLAFTANGNTNAAMVDKPARRFFPLCPWGQAMYAKGNGYCEFRLLPYGIAVEKEDPQPSRRSAYCRAMGSTPVGE